MFLYAVYLGAVGVLLIPIAASFHLTSAQVGGLFPANFGGFVAGVLVCGYLSDRLGRRRVLLAGLIGYAAGLMLFAVAPAFSTALAASALIGAGTGALETVASALASDLFPRRRAVILSAIQVAFGAGAAISAPLAAGLLARGTPWPFIYLGLAALNVAAAAALLPARLPAPGIGSERPRLGDAVRLLHRGDLVLLAVAQASYVGAEVSYFTWMPTFLEGDVRGGGPWAGWAVSVFWIAMTAGRVLTSGLAGRWAPMHLAAWMGAGGAVAAACSLPWASPGPIVAGVAVTGLFFAGLFGLVVAEAGNRYPAVAGTVFGLVIAAGGVGGAVLPWFVGILADAGLGWRGALLAAPAAVALTAAISARLARRR
ncbi:MAG: MFS transporter [Chthonomonadales bacterium]|nr:MFS transporter [Chthonomonadales bacterium]